MKLPWRAQCFWSGNLGLISKCGGFEAVGGTYATASGSGRVRKEGI